VERPLTVAASARSHPTGWRRNAWGAARPNAAAERGLAAARAALAAPVCEVSFEEYQAQQEQLRRDDEARRSAQGQLTLRVSG
jgi:hypothetical protein